MAKKREYVQANKDWLAEKMKEDGVMPLSDGICYKVLASGDPGGKRPSVSSIVTVHYTGWTIDGKIFDSSRDGATPVAFRLGDLIEGWIIALRRCVWAISGRSIFLRKKAMENSLSLAFPVARP